MLDRPQPTVCRSCCATLRRQPGCMQPGSGAHSVAPDPVAQLRREPTPLHTMARREFFAAANVRGDSGIGFYFVDASGKTHDFSALKCME